MNRTRLVTAGSIVLALLALVTSRAAAQTVAPGPYYATPSWDQKLAVPSRFVVLSNWTGAAVLDKETGLVWERSPSPATIDFTAAIQECRTKPVGGRKAWRLATIHELATLVDPSQSNPALPAGHPFIDVQPSTYVSSTGRGPNTSDNWALNFADGSIDFQGASVGFAWCVRGSTGSE